MRPCTQPLRNTGVLVYTCIHCIPSTKRLGSPRMDSHLSLECWISQSVSGCAVAAGHALDLAASTAALCLLIGRLKAAPQMRRLQISMLTAMDEPGWGGPGQQHIAERHAQLEMRVLRTLKDAMQCSTSLR